MEIVIDIPEKMYHMINAGFYDYGDMNVIIQNGTPLPKGHGRLIDANYKVSSDCRTVDTICGYLAPTIIEADKGESEDKE